jgi:NADH-quinone oxidoreductase subunit H
MSLISFSVFMMKVSFFLFLFLWIRWTIPRFRYDQLMNLGWKKLIPLALANMIITAAVILWLKK